MQPNDAYLVLLPLTLVTLLVGLTFVIWRWPDGTDLTFSQRVAKRRTSTLFYSLLFAITLPPLNLFFIGWFAPTFELSSWFVAFVLAASVLQLACTLIPETGGRKSQYHRLLAGVSVACLVPPMVILIFAPTVSTAGKVVSTAALIVMAIITAIIFHGKGKHSHLLWLQSSFYVAFFSAILAATYIR